MMNNTALQQRLSSPSTAWLRAWLLVAPPPAPQCGACGPGERLVSACTATAPAVCGMCTHGMWQDAAAHTQPACKTCAPGSRVNGGKTSCEACGDGQYPFFRADNASACCDACLNYKVDKFCQAWSWRATGSDPHRCASPHLG